MNLYYNQSYKGEIVLNESEIPKEILEKEQLKDNGLLNISNIYKKKDLLRGNIKESENKNLQNTDSNITIKESSKIKDNSVNTFNNNLILPENENKDLNKLKEENNTNDLRGEKINAVEEKNNNEINENFKQL